jgi:hypothetical protein
MNNDSNEPMTEAEPEQGTKGGHEIVTDTREKFLEHETTKGT